MLLLVCVLAGGCVKLAKSLGEVSKLQVEIVKEFGEKEVGVNINNDTVLTISFLNSPLNDKPPDERAQRAGQTMAFVKDHYPSIDKMHAIWVVFIRAQTRFIFVHYSETVAVFGFNKHGQLLTDPDGPPASATDRSLRPTAVYSPDSKQTDVMITGMQLPGDLNQGLTVSVYFKVRGDATGVRRADAPESVSFDFASYSEKSLFPGAPKIQVLADGKVAFQTATQFSTSKNADGLFSEFATIPVPYPAFRRAIAGERLTLKMGDQGYGFSSGQVKALRELARYVKE